MSRTDDVHFVEILGGYDAVQILNGSGSMSWEHRPTRFHAVLSWLKRERNRLNRLGITWRVQASNESKPQCLAENGRAQPVIWRSTWFYWRQNASGYLQSKRIKTDQKDPNCNPHLSNLLVDAPRKPLTQTEQTEQTEQTSHAVLQLMQIACACGLVNPLQMVPVGFEKKTCGKKATTVWQTPRHSFRCGTVREVTTLCCKDARCILE